MKSPEFDTNRTLNRTMSRSMSHWFEFGYSCFLALQNRHVHAVLVEPLACSVVPQAAICGINIFELLALFQRHVFRHPFSLTSCKNAQKINARETTWISLAFILQFQPKKLNFCKNRPSARKVFSQWLRGGRGFARSSPVPGQTQAKFNCIPL